MLKIIVLSSFLLCILLIFVVFRETQNHQREQLNQLLQEAKSSLDKIEKNQYYPVSNVEKNYSNSVKNDNQAIQVQQ